MSYKKSSKKGKRKDELLFVLNEEEWGRVVEKGLRGELLEVATNRTKSGLHKWLVEKGIKESRFVQIACQKCSVGVMDQTNPHLHGTCTCKCHEPTFVNQLVKRG
jgi:hypothetical protein